MRHPISLILLLLSYTGIAWAQAEDSYLLGPGDLIKILVYQEEDLSIQARIDKNGRIDYPLVGQVKLAGLTLPQAVQALDKRLRGDYLVDPRITISISEHRPFFVSGEVKEPGSYEFRPGMTVRQAIAVAGDFTDRASRSKISIIREGDTTYTEQKAGLDEKIGPGDTITVKEGFF